MVDIVPITDPTLTGGLPGGTITPRPILPTSTSGGDTFTRAPGSDPPLDPADPANAEIIAFQGQLAALMGFTAAGAGNGNPLTNMIKWMDIVGKCDDLISRIDSALARSITDRVKAIAQDMSAKVKAIIGLAKGNVEYWKDEQVSFFKAIKTVMELAKGSGV